MRAIVAIDNNWGIGKDGDLLFRIKEDMKFFREMTIGKVVVMGRKTFDSLPNGQPLKNRINLVITSEPRESNDNVVFGTMDQIQKEINKYDTNDIFIIGGASIYKQFIYLCSIVYVTHYDKVCEADTYMPNLELQGLRLNRIISEGIHEGAHWCIEEWI